MTVRNGRKPNGTNLPFELASALIAEYQESFDEKTVLSIKGAIRARQYRILAKLTTDVDPALLGSHAYSVLLQIQSLFRKNDQFTVDSDAAEAAWKSFDRGETLCRISNKRLEYYRLFPERMEPDVARFIKRIIQVISRVSGDTTRFLNSVPDGVRVTSGATLTTPRARSLPTHKMRGSCEMPVRSVPFIEALSRSLGVKCPEVVFVDTNRLVTVTKDWRSRRMIACEPGGLLPFQLAYDRYIKQRLLACLGIDLSNGQFENQRYAREGSISGSYATIDLSMASDTICLYLVAWLFPDSWVDLLSRLRVSNWRGKRNGTPVAGTYAKFSSMGNGTTFGLETLIFGAICAGVGCPEFKVYGDDLIVPTDYAADVLKMLRFLGFVPNPSKTFTTGPFRESCGGDFLDGARVTPFYLRREAKTSADLCLLVNGLLPFASKDQGPLSKLLFRIVSNSKLPLIPYNGVADSGVWVDATSAWNHGLIKRHHGVNRIRALTCREKSFRLRGTRPLEYWLFTRRSNRAPEDPFGSLQTSRSPTGVSRMRTRWIPWAPCPRDPSPPHLYRWGSLLTDFL